MKSARNPDFDGASDRSRGEPRQTLLGGLAVGLFSTVFIVRYLTPTDGATSGETLWIAQATLVALLLWSLAVLQSGRLRLRFDGLDVAAAALCLGHILSAAVVLATNGDKRAAMTLLWEWIGVAATFFLIRQYLTSPSTRRSLVVSVAAVAVCLAGLGLWQHHVGYTATRQAYLRLKAEQATLAAAGRPATADEARERERRQQELQTEFRRMEIPASESGRMLWEQRLMSSEPIGLFALANTLAGFIAPVLVLWLSAIASVNRRSSRWAIAGGIISIALIADCLVLTKSRTAFVGFLAGIATWRVRTHRSGIRSPAGLRWGMILGVIAAIALVVGSAFSGGFDRFVVTEAAKSLRYRIEYWTSTWQMLADSPRNWILGVGPGNFRQNYLPFKLPQSSEEIADPHHLVLDVWANGGLIGLIGLAGICFAAIRPLWRAPAAEVGGTPEKVVWNRWVFLGGGLAHLAALGLDFDNEEMLGLLGLLLCGWLTVVLLCQPLFANEPKSIVYASAVVVLVVHLLGAGGIGMPAITQTLLLLAALSLSTGDRGQPITSDSAPVPTSDRSGQVSAGGTASLESSADSRGWTIAPAASWPAAVVTLAAVALYVGCWSTGLAPLFEARALIASGKHELLDLGRPSPAERDFRRAAAVDPWSVEPAELLSQMFYQRSLVSPASRDSDFDRSVEWQREAISRNPRQAAEYRLLGELYLAKFATSSRKTDAALSADAFQQAAVLYPNHAQIQSELAEALWKAGRNPEARQAARQAQLLDSGNEQAGHIDKLLATERRELLRRILQSPAADPN